MNIRHVAERERFEVELDGGVAFVAYEALDGALDLVSTWVPPEERNRGVGAALVVHALEHARDAGLEVVPTCPFVPDVISRYPEYRSLVRR